MNRRGQSYLKQLKPNFQSVNSSLILIKHLLIFKMKLKLPIFITYYRQKKNDFNTPVIRLNIELKRMEHFISVLYANF